MYHTNNIVPRARRYESTKHPPVAVTTIRTNTTVFQLIKQKAYKLLRAPNCLFKMLPRGEAKPFCPRQWTKISSNTAIKIINNTRPGAIITRPWQFLSKERERKQTTREREREKERQKKNPRSGCKETPRGARARASTS